MKGKHKLLLVTPLMLLTLSACGIGDAQKRAQQTSQATQNASGSQSNTNTKVNQTDPIRSTQNLNDPTASNEASWLQQNGPALIKAVFNSNGSAKKAYVQGFNDGNDNGSYSWNTKYHTPSTQASNAMDSSGMTNGILRTSMMNNKYYRWGWILSAAQGSNSQPDGRYHGPQGTDKYQKMLNRYNGGMQWIKQHNEKQYAAYDDGYEKWYGHDAASVQTNNFG